MTIVVEPRAFAFTDVQSKTWQTRKGSTSWRSAGRAGHRPCGGRRQSPTGSPDTWADDIRGAPCARCGLTHRVSTIGEIRASTGQAVASGRPAGGGYQSAEDAATALMIERSVDEMPLRTVALFSQAKST